MKSIDQIKRIMDANHVLLSTGGGVQAVHATVHAPTDLEIFSKVLKTGSQQAGGGGGGSVARWLGGMFYKK